MISRKCRKRGKRARERERLPASNVEPSEAREEGHEERGLGGLERLRSPSPF